MNKRTATNLLDNLVGMIEDSQENDYDTALKMGIEALKSHTQPVQRWIPCSERLPEEDGLYLVTTSKGQVQMHVFNRNGNSEEYWMRCNKAWMPLPEPYKDGE